MVWSSSPSSSAWWPRRCRKMRSVSSSFTSSYDLSIIIDIKERVAIKSSKLQDYRRNNQFINPAVGGWSAKKDALMPILQLHQKVLHNCTKKCCTVSYRLQISVVIESWWFNHQLQDYTWNNQFIKLSVRLVTNANLAELHQKTSHISAHHWSRNKKCCCFVVKFYITFNSTGLEKI